MSDRVRKFHTASGAVLALALSAASPAFAQTTGTTGTGGVTDVANGYSIDIEFLRPTFGHQGFLGLDTPMTNRSLTFRYGTVLQYQQSPLTLYDAVENTELGSVVNNRFGALIGASLDLERVTFGLLLPAAFQRGTEQAAFGADGFGMGDVGASARLVVIQTPNDVFNVGARGGLILPTGKPNAYMGESGVRLQVGALAAVNAGPFTVGTDLGLMTRPTLATSEDFVASNEVVWGNGVRFRLPDATRTSLNAQVLTRAGFENFLRGGAENALEFLGGVDFYPTRRTTIGIGGGRGLTQGYGTTDFRVLGHLLIEIPPPEPAPAQYVYAEPPPPPMEPPPIDVLIEEPPPPLVFEEGELAKKVADRIYIRDMVEFVVDTNKLQDYSRPTLEAVAKLINESPEIAHLVIEGHASQEGSFDHNYELAESRARRIWEVLLELGVASDRVSYRGKGEVEPVKEGEDEESLQANRRVEFHIVHQYAGEDEYPDYPDYQTLPWNGQVVPVVKPPKPEPKVEETGPKTDEFGLPIDDDIDIGAPPGDTGDKKE